MEPWRVEEVAYGDLMLNNSWTFYEVYESSSYKKGKSTKEADYLNNIKPVGTFNNLIDFLYFWETTKYKDLTPIFTDPFTNTIRKIKNADLKIGSIALFKEKIEPKWEDPENRHGGEYSIKFNGVEANEIVKIWETMIFTLIGNSTELASEITGIRVADKTNFNRGEYNYKVEIWVLHGNDDAKNKLWIDKLKNLLRVDSVNFVAHKV